MDSSKGSRNNEIKSHEIEPSLTTDDGEVSLIDLFVIIWKRKIPIAIITFIFALGSLITGFLIEPTYTSLTTLMPIAGDKNSAMAQYSSLAAMAGISIPGSAGAATPGQKILAILRSRTICEQIVRDLDLVPHIIKNTNRIKNRDPFNVATEILQKTILSVANDDKSGLISLRAEFVDRKYAQKIVISATRILEEMLNSKSLTISQKSSKMLEKQISAQERKVANLQTRMASFQKDTKIISPEGQVTSAMTLYASLLEQKIALQVQLSRFESALSADNSLVTTLQSQLHEIEKLIRNIESKTGVGSFSFGSAPEQIVEYQNIARDLEIATKIYSSLLATYESQKLSEAKDQLYVEVVDPPLIPEVKSGPKRSMILVIGTLLGFSLGILSAFIINAIPNMRRRLGN